jgi:hypothetical protein
MLDLTFCLVKAIEHKKQTSTRRKSTMELFNEVVGEYNKGVQKSWRIISEKKSAVENLMRMCKQFHQVIASHLNRYKNEASGQES